MHRGLLQAHDDGPGLILGESREERVYFFLFLRRKAWPPTDSLPNHPQGGLALSLSSQPCELLVVMILPWGARPPRLLDCQVLGLGCWLSVVTSASPALSTAGLGRYILGSPWPSTTQSPRLGGEAGSCPE